MKTILTILILLMTMLPCNAYRFLYAFKDTPISEAIVRISKDHPDINISFIYKELDNYRTSARINTDDAFDALRQTIGLNPISVIRKDKNYYIEALQHGKFKYTGRVIGSDNEPVVAATVMLLSPNDSTVITYGITDNDGGFSIPCDRQGVIGKLSCLGYKTTLRKFDTFSVGTIIIPERTVALREIKVDADNTFLYPDKSVYIPSARQKRASTDATDLLRNMAIPQITVNPIDGKVTGNTGKPIAIYINNMEASKEELQGLNTQDVRKVEYLEFPTDPRFHGAEYVINFLVQEYEYGGYTKISTTDDFLIGFANNTTLYSKFSHEKWTLDLYMGSDNKNNHHHGNSTEATYSLIDETGNNYELKRSETLENSHYKQDQFPITLRATLNSDKVQVRNTLGYTHSDTHTDNQSGILKYDPSNGKEYSLSIQNPVVSNTCAYNGMVYLSLPKNVSINITPKFTFTHSNDRYMYETSFQDEAIVRNARENAYWYRVDASLSKKINDNNTIDFGVNGGEWINILTYRGTNNYHDTFHLGFAAALLAYNYRNRKVSMKARAGICHEPSRINNITDKLTYPFAGLNISWSPNFRNTLTAYLEYSTSSYTIQTKVSDVITQNEFMYITGNPHLKSAPMFGAMLSYMWIPSRNLSFNAYGSIIETFKRAVTVYEPFDNGNSLLRTYINDGNMINSSIGLSANWKTLNDRLQIYANGRQSVFRTTGIYYKMLCPFSFTLQATYYLGNFYFQAYWQSLQKQLDSINPETYSLRNFHNISMGWSDSRWNIRLTAANFFNHGWIDATEHLESNLYSNHTSITGVDTHSKIRVTASYTFGYGKKISVGNEIGQQSGSTSAILK
ncbi:MAG: TonB-dependent receptor family protein [Muribaculaceae bacterium]|nr:TonB-dependent receptor family protein [Muribaculaceae bacterium]